MRFPVKQEMTRYILSSPCRQESLKNIRLSIKFGVPRKIITQKHPFNNEHRTSLPAGQAGIYDFRSFYKKIFN